MCYLDVIASPAFDLVNSVILLLTVAVALFLVCSTVLLVVAFLQKFCDSKKKPEPDVPNQDDPQI